MQTFPSYKRCLAGLTFFLFFLLGNDLVAQDNKATAAQMVEIGDEIFNQTLAVEEARELYTTAVNMDGDNVRARSRMPRCAPPKWPQHDRQVRHQRRRHRNRRRRVTVHPRF